MAQYEVEWTELAAHKARIQAPPDDERMVEAAATGELVDWVKRDISSGAASRISYSSPETTVIALGQVNDDGSVRPL